MIFSFSFGFSENMLRISAYVFPLFFFFVQEAQAIIPTSQRRLILNLKIVSQKSFHFWKPFSYVLFPLQWWRQSKRVEIFEVRSTVLFSKPTANPMRSNTFQIIEIDYAGGMVFAHFFISCKDSFQRNFQLFAPIPQVKVTQGNVHKLFFGHLPQTGGGG